MPTVSPCTTRESRPREPVHEVESAVEQRDRQCNPFRRGQGLRLRTIVAPKLRFERPPIRRRVTWQGLHHPPPRGKVVVCWERVGLYGHSLWGLRPCPATGCMPRQPRFTSTTMGHGVPRRRARDFRGSLLSRSPTRGRWFRVSEHFHSGPHDIRSTQDVWQDALIRAGGYLVQPDEGPPDDRTA
jgi:hypothetical protein